SSGLRLWREVEKLTPRERGGAPLAALDMRLRRPFELEARGLDAGRRHGAVPSLATFDAGNSERSIRAQPCGISRQGLHGHAHEPPPLKDRSWTDVRARTRTRRLIRAWTGAGRGLGARG